MPKNDNTAEVRYIPPPATDFPENSPITNLVNTEMVIDSVEVKTNAKYGAIALFGIGGRFYRTTSKVLCDQAKGIKELLDSGKKVRTRLIKKKNYYTFSE